MRLCWTCWVRRRRDKLPKIKRCYRSKVSVVHWYCGEGGIRKGWWWWRWWCGRNWLKSRHVFSLFHCRSFPVWPRSAITIIIMGLSIPRCCKFGTHTVARFMYTCPYSSDLINRPHSFLHLRSLRGNLFSLLSVFPIAQPSPSLTYHSRCTNHTYLYSIWQNTIGTCVSCPHSRPSFISTGSRSCSSSFGFSSRRCSRRRLRY